MAKKSTRYLSRLKRKKRIQKKLRGSHERPRLCVFRSARHIYAQIVDDDSGVTLFSASTLDKALDLKGDKKEKAAEVGKLIGKRALDKGTAKVVFDRNGFLYHGRVKALSEGAREAGLDF